VRPIVITVLETYESCLFLVPATCEAFHSLAPAACQTCHILVQKAVRPVTSNPNQREVAQPFHIGA
jgi:hypothetical protein